VLINRRQILTCTKFVYGCWGRLASSSPRALYWRMPFCVPRAQRGNHFRFPRDESTASFCSLLKLCSNASTYSGHPPLVGLGFWALGRSIIRRTAPSPQNPNLPPLIKLCCFRFWARSQRFMLTDSPPPSPPIPWGRIRAFDSFFLPSCRILRHVLGGLRMNYLSLSVSASVRDIR